MTSKDVVRDWPAALRNQAALRPRGYTKQLMNQAADEIERLNQLLHEAAAAFTSGNEHCPTCRGVYNKIAAAKGYARFPDETSGEPDEPFRGSWNCKARRSNMGANDPQECDWPHCGCDDHASKVLKALTEEGWRPPEKAHG